MSQPAVSFEFFPPKSLRGSFRLWDCLGTLAPFDPSFVSVTYGAGGTTRQLTHDAVCAIGEQTGLPVAAHLTCVDASRSETLAIAQSYADAGVREIVALRGDPPKGAGQFEARPDGFTGSVELIEALANTGNFDIRVGAYPEVHPEGVGFDADIAHLKAKFDAGATSAITQFFFEADTYFRFRDACVKAGITAPIIPGILPIESWSGTQKFAGTCGTAIPPIMAQAFDNAARDGSHDLLATAVAAELCDDLLEGGVDHLHFYTLNKAALTRDVCLAFGLSRDGALQQVA